MKSKICKCAYCKAGGMSKSASECVDRMVEVSKRLKAFNKNINRDTVREAQLDEKRLETTIATELKVE